MITKQTLPREALGTTATSGPLYFHHISDVDDWLHLSALVHPSAFI